MTPPKRAARPANDPPEAHARQTARTGRVPAPPAPAKMARKPVTRSAASTQAKVAAIQPDTPAGGLAVKAVAKSARTTAGAAAPRLRAKVAKAEQSLASSLVHHIQDLPTKLLARLGTASDLAAVLVKAQMPKPASKALVDQAAHFLRDLREAAQLSLDDLARALTLEDASLLSLVESGKVGLPFDIILRMATVLGKNDPVGFVLKVTRAYNPGIWATLDKLGIGKLVVQAGREREFANIYRANEAARQLNDAEFAAALRFAATAFDTAVVLQQQARQAAAAAASATEG